MMKNVIRIVFLSLLIGVTPFTAKAQFFDILGSNSSIEIPFRYESNFIIVSLELNGSFPMNFIFDTGAEHTLLFKRTYTDLLRVHYGKVIKIYGSDLTSYVLANIVRNLKVSVPPIDPVKMDLLVMQQDYLRMDQLTGISIDGILGAQFFKNLVVKIDYRRGVITLYKADRFNRPNEKFLKLPIELKRNKPYVTAKSHINSIDSADLTLLLDTGAGIGLMLHSNTHRGIALPDNYIQTNLGVGIGGQITGYVGRIAEFNLSTFSFPNIITAFQDLPDESIDPKAVTRNGIIGNQLLSRFTVIIHYPHSIIYLKPIKRFKQTFEYDKSGLTLSAAGPYQSLFYVSHVIPGSAATKADIRVGDQIIRFKGIPATFTRLSKLTRALRGKNGKTIKVTIKRDDEKIKTQLTLKSIL